MLPGTKKAYVFFLICTLGFSLLSAQNTQIRGFVDAMILYDKSKVSFGFGEQDLFITSELTDRLSFLGESVFKFTSSSSTHFSVSVERIVLKYNIQGNNNIIIGKIHTPINYWNDTYHHGRVFFPTIERPLFYAAQIIPLHTTGISFQGHDFGKIKLGYDVVIGNGLGSEDVLDNDKRKSITAAVHIKPADRLKIMISYYNDAIEKGSMVNNKIIQWKVNQNLFTGSAAYFGKKFELLAESTLGANKTDTTGSKKTIASYIYTGYKINEKVIPYLRFDNIKFHDGEMFYNKDNTTAVVAGLRYQINYLAVVKLEYQQQHAEIERRTNKVTAQLAIGF